MTTKKRRAKSPIGNLVVPVEERKGQMDTESYTDAMNGFMRYMWTGRFRKRNERQN